MHEAGNSQLAIAAALVSVCSWAAPIDAVR